jgi:hypothetical protein
MFSSCPLTGVLVVPHFLVTTGVEPAERVRVFAVTSNDIAFCQFIYHFAALFTNVIFHCFLQYGIRGNPGYRYRSFPGKSRTGE